MTKTLWTIQILLALIFLVAGGAKLVTPMDEVAKQTGLSVALLHFVAVCEVLGAIGLILPGLLHIKPGLTPLAAAGLVIIMIGAVVVSLKGGIVMALFPLVVGLLAAFVVYGSWSLAPSGSKS
jgi:uncharacterized membrane protein YphA (DoxX/SURF4 family)